MQDVFADWVLDTERRELRRAGVPGTRAPKVYQVLVSLVQHAERLVTPEELFEHVWPNLYVEPIAIARSITAIRRAVGDSGDAQRVIRTLHRQM